MNNNNQFEKFIRDLNGIRMSDDQKNEMRSNLESFTSNYELKTMRSPYQFAMMFRRPLAIALIVLLAMGSTKPASASALPGEILYPVKIIHEEIEAATKTTPEKKANFKIEQTEKRIQEAIKLADDEKLDSKTQNQLAANIKTYTEDIAVEIKEIKQEDPQKALEITADLKTTLKSNSGALKKITTSKKEKQVSKKTKESKPEIVEVQTKEEVLETITKEENVIESDDLEILEASDTGEAPEIDPVIEENIVTDKISEAEKNPEVNPVIEEGITHNTSVETVGASSELGLAIDDVEYTDIALVTETNGDENTSTEQIIYEEDEDTTLLDSLELDLLFTETIEDEVKEEIIKTLDETPVVETADEEIINKEVVETIESPEPITEINVEILSIDAAEESAAVDPVTDDPTNVLPEDLGVDPIDETTLLIDSVITLETVFTPDAAPADKDIVPVTPSVIHTESLIPTEDKIKNEITALENVSTLKERLNLLEETHIIIKTLEELTLRDKELQTLINKGQYGQAIIYLQAEIDTINEITQTKEIEEELGISSDEFITENNTPSLSEEPINLVLD